MLQAQYGAPLAVIAAEIIRPALSAAGIWSQALETLVLGTGAHESHYQFIKQIGPGPALGWWQSEPATHDDIWANWLRYRAPLATAVNQLRNGETSGMALVRYPLYAAALCGVHYVRTRKGSLLPPHDDAQLQAISWKNSYNSRLGKGTVEQALPHFEAAVEATK